MAAKSPKLSPEEIREINDKHNIKQATKAVEKKKTSRYSYSECMSEMARLEKTDHQSSTYYQHVMRRAADTVEQAY